MRLFSFVYLNELDYFVKHNLKAKYYIRYVDDFVILDNNYKDLEKYQSDINEYIEKNLRLELHPDKSKIIKLKNGASLLGYRIYYYHKLLRKSNKRKFERDFSEKLNLYKEGFLSYEDLICSLQGWFGYAMWADTYKLRRYIIKKINQNNN